MVGSSIWWTGRETGPKSGPEIPPVTSWTLTSFGLFGGIVRLALGRHEPPLPWGWGYCKSWHQAEASLWWPESTTPIIGLNTQQLGWTLYKPSDPVTQCWVFAKVLSQAPSRSTNVQPRLLGSVGLNKSKSNLGTGEPNQYSGDCEQGRHSARMRNLSALLFVLLLCSLQLVSSAPSERRKTKCEQERDNVMVKHMIGAFIPQCDEKGHYRPLQCHPSTGYCWCVDCMGREIAGTNTPPGTKTPNCEAPDHPKTKCEQERDNVTVKHMIGAFIPQCDEEGHYRPLQCHPSTGYCWCVNSTGQKVEGTISPPGTPTPDCESEDHPKTKCEQERDNVMVKHMIGAFIPQCDEEGHYRPLQCHPSTGYCWCVDCMGREIAGTNTPPGTKTPNCKAAERRKTKCEQERDNVTVKHMIGAFIPQCDEKGHYRPLQCHPSTGYCWCVDCMGREIAGTNTPPGTKTPNCEAAGWLPPDSPPPGVLRIHPCLDLSRASPPCSADSFMC
ncbi:hypothetical protein P4O66_020623 [Electrophorus voltai]|uniref:Thyroglobulin type-1 domain-containing protein n=1 Tax=Electrophorus voltai TaxID=2609070 RepID=A0AAD9E4C3_9TELE|nr:hypothetical protein P4O66_020623 [Electrophorus voltai]